MKEPSQIFKDEIETPNYVQTENKLESKILAKPNLQTISLEQPLNMKSLKKKSLSPSRNLSQTIKIKKDLDNAQLMERVGQSDKV